MFFENLKQKKRDTSPFTASCPFCIRPLIPFKSGNRSTAPAFGKKLLKSAARLTDSLEGR
ncbi:hypothetical protein DX928_08925 [Bacillus swezeyi]|uniref:Uncharacterized protein n=1 Tax=Bacillus swezeyi TaxID=1925020 RepID=A0A5M8S4W0_9BACI|nr:hypothetical protein DX927_02995 [Bacillus swezeyi]KAA6476189.1 hypothetical protein DX928_08925 [Bacillus swezeyi]